MEPITAAFDEPVQLCHLCHSSRIRSYFRDESERSIFICEDCGIQFMNPQYSMAYLNEYYSQYTPADTPEDDLRILNAWRPIIELFEHFTGSKGTLLDVGCGSGHSLQAAVEKGWAATGYEIDPELARRVAGKLGVDVHSGDFTQIGWKPAAYDVVSLSHVIEHLKNPIPYFETIRATLKADGVLYLALPNIYSFSSRGKFFLEKLGLKRKNIGRYYDTDHHLFYYGPRSVRRFLHANGFDVVDMCNHNPHEPRSANPFDRINRTLLNRVHYESSFYVIARKR